MTASSIDQLARKVCKDRVGTNSQQLLLAAGIEQQVPSITQHSANQHDSSRLIMAARMLAETQPAYSDVASNILYRQLCSDTYSALGLTTNTNDMYAQGFLRYIHKGVQCGLLQPEIIAYDLVFLSLKLVARLDHNLAYTELQALVSQHLLKEQGKCFELPQYAFMRIAIALAIKENQSEQRVAEIYRLLSVRSYSRISPKTLSAGTLEQPYFRTVKNDQRLRLVN
ncbi:hypothetical protein A9Q99_10850 [Gammaproteobacteria bacterium 45_16_T64]|nr:hypothetical protein A9Q99_10850 [Gammaproteobacteria bacterium 45_16_T64]